MGKTLLASLITLTALMFASPAAAYTSIYPASQDTFYTEVWYIGMGDVTNDGVTNRIAMICVDEIGTSGTCSCTGSDCSCTGSRDRTIDIGDTSGMADDYGVHGDIASSSSGGRDEMFLVPFNGFRPASNSFCGDNGFLGGIMRTTWNTLSYSGSHYLDLFGEEGDDLLDNGTTGANTWMDGDAGNDDLLNRATSAQALGDTGSDDMCSYPSGDAEDIQAGTGNDCLRDYTRGGYWLSCGGDTSDTIAYASDYSDDGSCEYHQPSFTCNCP